MFIEIRNVGFMNKGAELMLHAIVQKLRQELPCAHLVVAPQDSAYEKRAAMRLYQKLWFRKFGIQWGRLGWLIHPKLRERFGLVTDTQINVVLDASGLWYSDQYGVQPTVEMAALVRKWKRQGTKVILMPQALGPFNSGAIRKAIKYVALKADLMFPRDDVSYKAVAELVGEQPHIRQAPDFTNLVQGVLPPEFDAQRNRFCLVPNCRMLDKTSSAEAAGYPAFLAECVRYLLNREAGPFLLVHSSREDLPLAKQVAKMAGGKLDIIEEDDPLRLKGIIGRCTGMIGSRYHGLVSALSQAVPVLAIGWSHKYETLLQEYGMEQNRLSVLDEPVEAHAKIDALLDESRVGALRATLGEAAQQQRLRAEQMWGEVLACIGGMNAK